MPFVSKSIVNIWSPALSSSDRGLSAYEIAFEIETGATVGSAAVATPPDESGTFFIISQSQLHDSDIPFGIDQLALFNLHRRCGIIYTQL